MGKDKRRNLNVYVRGDSNQVFVEDSAEETKYLHMRKFIHTTQLPVSAEEIILKIDMLSIKWKQITFSDYRYRRGVMFTRRYFAGDTIVLTKNDTRNSDVYDEKLNAINTKVLKL